VPVVDADANAHAATDDEDQDPTRPLRGIAPPRALVARSQSGECKGLLAGTAKRCSRARQGAGGVAPEAAARGEARNRTRRSLPPDPGGEQKKPPRRGGFLGT
jgi:hypothetical protein